jgi:hypothetical protein
MFHPSEQYSPGAAAAMKSGRTYAESGLNFLHSKIIEKLIHFKHI